MCAILVTIQCRQTQSGRAKPSVPTALPSPLHTYLCAWIDVPALDPPRLRQCSAPTLRPAHNSCQISATFWRRQRARPRARTPRSRRVRSSPSCQHAPPRRQPHVNLTSTAHAAHDRARARAAPSRPRAHGPHAASSYFSHLLCLQL